MERIGGLELLPVRRLLDVRGKRGVACSSITQCAVVRLGRRCGGAHVDFPEKPPAQDRFDVLALRGRHYPRRTAHHRLDLPEGLVQRRDKLGGLTGERVALSLCRARVPCQCQHQHSRAVGRSHPLGQRLQERRELARRSAHPAHILCRLVDHEQHRRVTDQLVQEPRSRSYSPAIGNLDLPVAVRTTQLPGDLTPHVPDDNVPVGNAVGRLEVAANDRHDPHRLGGHRPGVHTHYPQRFRGRLRADEVVEADQRMGLAPAEGRVEPEESRCRGVPARQPPDDLADERLGSIGRIRIGEEEVGILIHLVGLAAYDCGQVGREHLVAQLPGQHLVSRDTSLTEWLESGHCSLSPTTTILQSTRDREIERVSLWRTYLRSDVLPSIRGARLPEQVEFRSFVFRYVPKHGLAELAIRDPCFSSPGSLDELLSSFRIRLPSTGANAQVLCKCDRVGRDCLFKFYPLALLEDPHLSFHRAEVVFGFISAPRYGAVM